MTFRFLWFLYKMAKTYNGSGRTRGLGRHVGPRHHALSRTQTMLLCWWDTHANSSIVFFLKVPHVHRGKIYPTKLAGILANLILGPDMQRERWHVLLHRVLFAQSLRRDIRVVLLSGRRQTCQGVTNYNFLNSMCVECHGVYLCKNDTPLWVLHLRSFFWLSVAFPCKNLSRRRDDMSCCAESALWGVEAVTSGLSCFQVAKTLSRRVETQFPATYERKRHEYANRSWLLSITSWRKSYLDGRVLEWCKRYNQ